MYSKVHFARAGAGTGIVVALAFALSACGGEQNPPSAQGAAPAPAAPTVTATTATKAPAPVQVAEPVPAKASTPASACASATKATLEAAFKANEKASAALVVDSRGLQRIKCEGSWAFAHFTNELDGGRMLFANQNGKWVMRNGGTGQLCEDVPAAVAARICD
ncbi:hypothetical protein [Amycolatopsis rifamycinica]|uniref:Lipoprotein n=1 Tax=Amycolatopsis rifamycinica TaxID=287986 RepID=A0A066TQ00_9PSEU|nr:hypothetical protein [Amycolatopsis rifamycinica]KDN16940.1 hypothetical protein DV20_38205 [Amycolatopsis rifamycinica]